MKKGISGFGTIVNLILTLAFVVLIVMVYRYVVQANAPEALPIRYPFFNDSSIPVVQVDIPEPSVMAIKKFSSLQINNAEGMDLYKDRLKCSDVVVEGSVKGKKIILDPTHGGTDDKGLVVDGKIESDLVRGLALKISMTGLTGTATRDLNHDYSGERIETSDRLEKVADQDIILSFGGSEGSDVLAFVRDDADSMKVACEIINKLLESNVGDKIMGFSVIPIDPDLLSIDDQKRILVKEKIAVYFEIGLDLIEPIDADMIGEGLKNAYK